MKSEVSVLIWWTHKVINQTSESKEALEVFSGASLHLHMRFNAADLKR